MISVLLSRIIILVFGTLYPAYASFKAVRTKNVKEYVKWMMYWIVFALFTCIETFADMFLAFWLPFYYELKILFVLWLLAPATKGASILYRKFVHPRLVKHEEDIDSYIAKVSDKGYSAVVELGQKGFSYVTNAILTATMKGQTKLADHLKKSYSLGDVSEDQVDGLNVDMYGRRRRNTLESSADAGGDDDFADDVDEYDFDAEIIDSNRMVEKYAQQKLRSERGDSERDLYPGDEKLDDSGLKQVRHKKTTYSHKEASHIGTLPRSTRATRSRPAININKS